MTLNKALLREEGKQNYFYANGNQEKLLLGIKQLDQASKLGDADAAFILGEQFLAGKLQIEGKTQEEAGMEYLHRAKLRGSFQARAMINQICMDRYGKTFQYDRCDPKPLVGFDGRPILINRTGRAYPVDASLSFDGKMNCLDFRANIDFSLLDLSGDTFQQCAKTIIAGFRDWTGDYEVFGGQPLKVNVELTSTGRFIDSVHVVELTDKFSEILTSLVDKTSWGKNKRRKIDLLRHQRSFAAIGLDRWSVRSAKYVFFHSPDLRSGDYAELRSIARHEFGHVLGLGDLYACEEDAYNGLAPGSYPETDCFHLYGKTYRMVMCCEDAPPTNNDIEMVILAFSQNKFQFYQDEACGEISEALGRGN